MRSCTAPLPRFAFETCQWTSTFVPTAPQQCETRCTTRRCRTDNTKNSTNPTERKPRRTGAFDLLKQSHKTRWGLNHFPSQYKVAAFSQLVQCVSVALLLYSLNKRKKPTRHSGADRSTEDAFREAHRQGGWKGRPKGHGQTEKEAHTHTRTYRRNTNIRYRQHPVADLRFDTWASSAISDHRMFLENMCRSQAKVKLTAIILPAHTWKTRLTVSTTVKL